MRATTSSCKGLTACSPHKASVGNVLRTDLASHPTLISAARLPRSSSPLVPTPSLAAATAEPAVLVLPPSPFTWRAACLGCLAAPTLLTVCTPAFGWPQTRIGEQVPVGNELAVDAPRESNLDPLSDANPLPQMLRQARVSFPSLVAVARHEGAIRPMRVLKDHDVVGALSRDDLDRIAKLVLQLLHVPLRHDDHVQALPQKV
mmetsp:Transcript_85520/g.240658  ORF Transcript_85520/g.240658 Transcript_85520/m.240658 type:complete len:203 (+) Transcript_85520:42-650(+)